MPPYRRLAALGGVLRGYIGYAFATRLEWAIARVCKESPLPPEEGVSDGELDG